MISVYIVEDSIPALSELIFTIDWQSLGCRVVGSASDSFAAEKEIRILSPQLVITDVQMPLRDGLEMIKALSDMEGIYYIVISAYRLFEYAQRAIKLNTFDYILKPIDDEELYRSIENVVYAITSRGQADAPYGKHEWSSNLQSAVEYVEQHYQSELSVSQVAGELYISESYLGKMFRKEMGKSFTEYVNYVRIRNAMELLRKTTRKSYEIAQMVGIHNETYFSMLFKKTVGMTPLLYRRMNKNS